MARLPVIQPCESVTALSEVDGKVLVAGSHGGLVAASYAAKALVHAVIFNDAGIGLDDAGVAGLRWLDAIGMAAAAADHRSARIGDGEDMLANGVITRVNACAARAGVYEGQSCKEAADRLRRAPGATKAPPAYAEGRWRLKEGPPEVWALDSVGMLTPGDAGRILVIGSHGGLHGGDPRTALGIAGKPVDAAGAVFSDAGIGKDGAGVTRLPVLDARGIAAATVDCRTGRIGDSRSMWATGILSTVNERARAAGVKVGDSVALFVERVTAAQQGR